MKRLAILYTILCITAAAAAQTYYLPKTEIRLHLLVERQTFTPGPYARYADRYLRLKAVGQDELVSHRVVSCDVTTLGIRDTSRCYTLQLKTKGTPPDVRLSDDGVLLSINAEPLTATPLPPFKSAPQPTATDPRQYFTADIIAAASTAKQAELTARLLTELREQRQLLATGEADEQPQDEQQLRLMLQRIDQQHDALMTLFTGTTRRDTTQHTITLCPDRETERQVVFRLSRQLGLVDTDDLAGIPFYMTLTNLYPSTGDTTGDKKKQPADGITVALPSMGRLTLWQEDVQLAQFDIPLAQFGTVEVRDASAFKRYPVRLLLHPATGAVVRMAVEE